MSQLMDFFVNHQAVLAGVVVAVLDLAFALSDKFAANGIAHFLYLQAKKFAGSKQG